MNTYQISFYLRLPDGSVRGCTQLFAAPTATEAILQLETLPWPGELTGPYQWSLVGPRIAPPRNSGPEQGGSGRRVEWAALHLSPPLEHPTLLPAA